MTSIYDIGDEVRCSVTFTDQDGNDADPGTVEFKYQQPDGTETTYTYGTDPEVVKSSTGNYHVDVSVTAAGYWYYRWEGTGVVQSASEAWFVARRSEF